MIFFRKTVAKAAFYVYNRVSKGRVDRGKEDVRAG